MPGRKQPPEREEDRDYRYRMQQKREQGEAMGEDIDLREPGAQVAREREEYKERKERVSRQDF